MERIRPTSAEPILFQEQDAIYWLRGQDFARAKTLLGLCSDARAIGFDRTTWLIYAEDLARQGATIGVVQDQLVRMLHLHRPKPVHPVQSNPSELAPLQLFGTVELARLARRLAHTHSPLRAAFDQLADELAHGRAEAFADHGTLYAYQVAEDLYEVDGELTTVPPTYVEALALMAHRAGAKLPCQLVPPKPRRGRTSVKPQPMLRGAEAVPYGQLSLPFSTSRTLAEGSGAVGPG